MLCSKLKLLFPIHSTSFFRTSGNSWNHRARLTWKFLERTYHHSTTLPTESFVKSAKVAHSDKVEIVRIISPVAMGSSETEMDQKAMSQYILPLDQPVVNLDCVEAFNGLTEREKKYAHFLSLACWNGGLVVLAQTSPESPVVFSILHDMFKSNGLEGLKTIAIQDCNFTADEWKALVVYFSGILSNMGNYKGFGDTKFIPGVPVNKLSQLVGQAKFLGLSGEEVCIKWEAVKDKMYSLSEREKQLGLGTKGITTYFSDNCTTEDSELIVRFLKKEKLEAWNTRCFKETEGAFVSYEVRSASSELNDGSQKTCDFEGAKITLSKGDYSPLMSLVVANLEKAKPFASNDTEKSMIDCYIQSFQTGSVDFHKDGSRYWIKDKGPAIETYIGFIETYRDPTGVRAEFEGFVAVMNRTMSKKFTTLVEQAPEFLKLLPWSAEFEKDKFMKPDFTSLDVLTFSGSGIPAGINIPNYDQIRQDEGFKNVSLGNVIPASYKDAVIPFLSTEDKDLLNKYRVPAFEVQVALHELLGHGSGKLLKKEANGKTNFSADLKNPITGQLIEHVYDSEDTYDSVFGDLGSSFEECRAESVGLLLSLDKNILSQIFGFEGEEAENIIYTNWLSMIFAGAAKALEMYQPNSRSWMQAHSHARFAILQVLVDAGEGLVTIEETKGADGKPDLLISLDRSKIDTVGRQAISDFLLKLQVFKATADIGSARKLFARYTTVTNEGKYPWANWRDIVMDKKQPRKFMVQHNTVLSGDAVTIKFYDASPEGVVQSWIERFPDNSIYKALDYCWMKDKPHF